MDLGPSGTSARGEVHESRPPVFLDIATGEIAESLQALKELIHGLLAHSGAVRKLARPRAVRAGILQHPHVWQTQIRKASAVQARNDAAMDGLGRDSQQSADQRILRKIET